MLATLLFGGAQMISPPGGGEVGSRTVTIELLDAQGKPAEGIHYAVINTGETVVGATNSKGIATIRLNSLKQKETIGIRFAAAEDQNWDPKAFRTYLARLSGFLRNNYYPHHGRFQPTYELTMGELDQEPRVLFKAEPATTVRGVLSDAARGGPFTEAMVRARCGNDLVARPNRNGHFVLYGVACVKSNELFIHAPPQVISKSFDCQPSVRETDIEMLVVSPLASGGKAMIGCRGLDAAPQELGRSISHGITMFSADGQTILTYFCDEKGVMYLYLGQEGGVDVPLGRYFLCPGLFSGDPIQLALLDALRSQRDVSKCGFSLIEVKAEEIARGEVNLRDYMGSLEVLRESGTQ